MDVFRLGARIGSRALLLFLIGLNSVFSFAAESGRVLQYSLSQGLSFGIVNSIVQGPDGLMWFATGDGLNRFDGTSFKVFKNNPDDPNSISGNYVRSVFRDREGTIWTTSRIGLNEFVAGREIFRRHIPNPGASTPGNDVSDIAQAADGNLWVSLNGSGFAFFNKKRLHLPTITSAPCPACLRILS